MRVTAAATLALALLPAPAPPPRPEEEQAREALDALKQKLPAAVSEWVGKEGLWDLKYKGSVKSLRLTGPVEAKLTVRLEAFTFDPRVQGDVKAPQCDELLVVRLKCYQGVWTATGFEGTWTDSHKGNDRGAKFLMAAIDELGEK
jgi:hypothetical protein